MDKSMLVLDIVIALAILTVPVSLWCIGERGLAVMLFIMASVGFVAVIVDEILTIKNK